jgi:hypothetical protein
MLRITNEKGIPFSVRMVFRGQHYGTHMQLSHDEDEPLVEFYDASSVPNHGLGQFVSRYHLNTLIENHHPQSHGLDLDGGVPDWKITAENMKEVLEWAEGETKGFARYVRATPGESWRALMESDKGLEIMREIAETYGITRGMGDEVLAETDPENFMSCYRAALKLAKEYPNRDWDSIINEAFEDGFKSKWAMVDSAIEAFRISIDRSSGGNMAAAEADIRNAVAYFGEQYAVAHDLDESDAELIMERALTDWLCDSENPVGTSGDTLYDIFASTFDIRDWIATDYTKVEFPIWLNKKESESLDTAWLYQSQMTDRLDEEGVTAIRSMLEFANVSGADLIEASVDDAFTPDDPALIDKIMAIQSDPDKPALLSAKEILYALGEATRGGVPVVYAFIPSNEVIQADPRQPIKIEAHTTKSLQFGIHDSIYGSGYLDSMVQEFTLPPGALMDKYSVGNVGTYGINGVYSFYTPEVTAHMSNPAPALNHGCDGLDEPARNKGAYMGM